MGEYTPKPGDRIEMRATPRPPQWGAAFVVHHITNGRVHYTNSFGEADSVSTADYEFRPAAPVPFVVGGPITPEMGEPPEYSILGAGGNQAFCLIRWTGGWITVGSGTTLPEKWSRVRTLWGPLILLRLGDGSVNP